MKDTRPDTGHDTGRRDIGHETGEPWGRLVSAVAQGSALQLDTRIEVGRLAPRVPEGVLKAIVGAAREALRNVARHAGVDRAELVLKVSRRAIELHVSDQGSGVGGDASPGYGISESIQLRMEQVGGVAEVGPRPQGPGTTVRLHWRLPRVTPNERIQRSYDLSMGTSGGVAIVGIVAYPVLLANILVALHASRTAERPLATVALTCLLAVLLLIARRRLVTKAPTLVTVLSWVAGMALVEALGLWLAGKGSVTNFQSFVVGFANLPLVLFAYVLPFRYVPLLITPMVGVVVVATGVDDSVTWDAAIGCYNSVVAFSLLAGALGASLRRSTARIEEQRGRAVRAEEDSLRAHYLERARGQYLRHTEERILPWLESIADERTDFTSDEARTRATLLGSEARDDLYAPAFLDGRLRELVTAYRSRGGRVVVRAGVAPGAADRISGRILRRLVEALPPSHRITISAQPGTDQVRMVVVPAAPADVLAQVEAEHPGLRPTGDEFATVLGFHDLPASGDSPRPL